MGTLIDTSVLVPAERGDIDQARLAAEDDDEPIVIAAITASELLHGMHGCAAVVRTGAERFVEALLSSMPIIPFDLEIARVHATPT